jgi:hypothetical protein
MTHRTVLSSRIRMLTGAALLGARCLFHAGPGQVPGPGEECQLGGAVREPYGNAHGRKPG